MARHAGILQTGPKAVFDEHIAVTDAAGLDLDPHPSGWGLRDFAFHEFKWPAGVADLGGSHLGHK